MLIRWTPRSDFANLFSSLDNQLQHGTGTAMGLDENSSYPSVETFRRGENLILRAEVPGVEPGDIDVHVEEGRLILKGEKKRVLEESDTEVYVRETSYGRFQRSFRLPRGVKAEQLQARCNNGVLEITVPLHSLEDASRKVPIQVIKDSTTTEEARTA